MVLETCSRCRDFMVKLCEEIKKRYDFSDPLFGMISFFDPTRILKHETRDQLPTLVDLVARVPRLYQGDLQTLDNEWRALDTSVIPDDLRNYDPKKVGPVVFYQQLASLEFDGQLLFKNLCIFAFRLLALPVSNADAERLFSKLNHLKTETRNRMSIATARALLHVKEFVKDQEACYLAQPTDEMLNL